MCGIAGEIRWDGGEPAGQDVTLATLRHRGPDAEGAFARGNAWVGQTRLSIIDVSTGDPPISNETDDLGVALNGEIYNFRELRSGLEARGHRFTTRGDTEVIAHLAEELEPTELAAALDGMFGVAVWDARHGRLTLARDRFGKKPLHYWQDARGLVFGSEIKAVLAHPRVPRRLRTDAIADYLTFGYVPTPDTFYEEIRSVPPGHVLVVEDGRVTLTAYWEPRWPGAAGGPRLDVSFDEAARRVRSSLQAAVEKRLISDVPLGAFLSGGIDSSAVVGMMARAAGSGVATFTIGFEDDEGFDERPFAEAVARRHGTDHTEFVVKPDAADLMERLVEHHDSPFGDSSALPTYLLSELTAKHVTVALCGDGGDELFGGYERFAAALALAHWERVPARARTALRDFAVARRPAGGSTLAKVRRAMARSDLTAPEGLLAWVSYVPAEQREQLIGTAHAPGIERYMEIWQRSDGSATLDRLLDLNLRTYLLDDLLPKVDRMSMAHSLEVRAPFLDRDVAELAFRLKPSTKIRGLRLKRVLKAAVADLLPPELLNRPKRGFGIPLDRWMRTDLASMLTGTLGSDASLVGDHVHRAAVQRLIDEHQRGAANHGHALWTLLTLELFLRRESA
jgi:asparagine synthase (glutamine-hydrolysing)